jgi:hypothetical protein
MMTPPNDDTTPGKRPLRAICHKVKVKVKTWTQGW